MTAHTKIEAQDEAQPRKGENLADMWERCKHTKWELAALQNIATATRYARDPLEREVHTCATDAAHGCESAEEREAFIEAMETVFKRWDAEEAYRDAAYCYEQCTGRDWETSPALFDREQWIADWIEEGERS